MPFQLMINLGLTPILYTVHLQINGLKALYLLFHGERVSCRSLQKAVMLHAGAVCAAQSALSVQSLLLQQVWPWAEIWETKCQSNAGTHRCSSAILKADVDHGASCVTSLQFRFISSQTAHHSYDARKIRRFIPTIPIFILLCKNKVESAGRGTTLS